MDIRTWYEGKWHEGNIAILGVSDHATWLGTLVFDGARYFEGISPDLALHLARANDSCTGMGMNPTMSVDEMVKICKQGFAMFPEDTALYVRPMYWSRHAAKYVIAPDPDSTAFALCLEARPLGNSAGFTMTTTQFCRPSFSMMPTNAKAACLYPNNGRMLTEAYRKGFDNALVCDALGNVAETATSNIFIVKDGVVKTPIPNGTFLAGITRSRIMTLLKDDGVTVEETILSVEDVREADEVFATGNFSKVVPVTQFEDRTFTQSLISQRARKLYWDWAHAAN